MPDVADLLPEVDSALRTNRPTLYECLRPPLDGAGIDDWQQALGVSVPEGLAALHRWKDGQSDLCPEPLYGSWSLVPADIAVEIKRAYDEMVAAGEPRSPDYWDPGWVPLLQDGTGNLVCLDTAAALGGAVGQLVGFSAERTRRTVEFGHLAEFLDVLLAATRSHGAGVPADLPRPPGYPVELGRR